MGDSIRDNDFGCSAAKRSRPNSDTVEEGRSKPLESKIFKDPIHGSIELHPLLVNIIDTPQFQRLRDLKQLGGVYWVYPGACHNRFEHCIGTSYLCGNLLKKLRERHGYNDDLISKKDILCAEIAGLCHDLGHGPFSHLFDKVYLKYVKPESNWTHEQGSIDMFDHMLKSNEALRKSFAEYGIRDNENQLIKEMIMGKDPNKDDISQSCNFDGRKRDKWFLFEIVSNKRSGIDCDKFDYLLRDSHYLGINSNFDYARYFQNIEIMPVDNQLQICVRDKEHFNLYELYYTRMSLHNKACQHKTTKVVEQMLVEALSKVDDKFKISHSISDMSVYTYMSDSIIYEILRSSDDSTDVKEAKKTLVRIQHRDLYKFCGQVNIMERPELINKDINKIAKEVSSKDQELKSDSLFVDKVRFTSGMKGKDPLESVIFFTKERKPMKMRKDQVSKLIPNRFEDTSIRIYSKDPEKKQQVQACFTEWCEDNSLPKPHFLEGDESGYFTDVHKDQIQKKEHEDNRQKNLKDSAVRRILYPVENN